MQTEPPTDGLSRALELERAGDVRQAELSYRQMLAKNPYDPRALHLLGLLCFRSRRITEAIDLTSRSIRACPNVPGVHSDLASMLGTMGRMAESLAALRQAVDLAPGQASLHNNLGVTLERMGRIDEAAGAFVRAVQLAPAKPGFHTNYGNSLRKAGRYGAATAAFRRAVEVDPAFYPAHENLAGVLQEQVEHDEALAAFRRAIELRPNDPGLHSSFLYSIHYHPRLSPRQIFDEHLAWAERHEAPLLRQAAARPHENDRSPDRRLRIGYVSPDFRRHSVATFVEPLLTHHDHDQFEITCYSSVKRPDALTERLRGKVDRWRDVVRLSDAQLAALIRDDWIDILVDVTGHMGDNRLPVFARRPAPVQVTYVGHPNTTGMQSMDYRLTDLHLDPPNGGSDQYHTEKLIRLPRVFGSYQVPEERLDVRPPPVERNGFITFGCLNNPAKITEPALRLWAEILAAVPRSQLALLGREVPSRMAAVFAGAGVDAGRVRRLGAMRRSAYLEAFNAIDLALDCFPYNGQTTTCDGFWMGVPIVALEGNSYVSRMGACLLRQVGIDEMIAPNPERYREICCQWAHNPRQLTVIRRGLRERLLSSPGVDGRFLAADIGMAYRRMWRAYAVR